MKSHFRWLMLGFVLVLVVTSLGLGAPKSHAAATYFIYFDNIRSMACSDTSFSFISDDIYNAPPSGYLMNYTVVTSEGFSFDSGQYLPTAVDPGQSGTISDDNWGYTGWPAVALGTAYQITLTMNFWVDSGLASQSIATFDCSADVQGRTLTLASLVNHAGSLEPGAGAAPGCDVLVPLPLTAVVGSLVADAPVYWTPGQVTSPLITLPSGKTAWVIGKDASGGYYKILWVCQFVWVPVSTMGPNYDAVWQGRPLPTDVVQ